MMMNNDEFVAEIIHTRAQGPPVIICYTDEQIMDLRSFLTTKSGVEGIDRAFHMGKCFVTTLVYKSHKVVRKSTREPSIWVGPIFLHWGGLKRTYDIFQPYK